MPGKSKRLIVSGDDFGLSPEVNAGILTAHRAGILTNASLMVRGPAAEEAVHLARENPSLGVGLHLTLASGRSTLPPKAIPGLVGEEGFFQKNPIKAGLQYFFCPRLRSALLKECRAQIEAFLATGLTLSHIDGHLNLHLHPTILTLLLELAREYPIRALRLTRENLRVGLRLDPKGALRKVGEGAVFALLSLWAKRKLRASGLKYTDHLFGLHQTGRLSEAYLLGLIPHLRKGTTELYCHPSHPSNCREVAALTSPRVRQALEQKGIALISYHDLMV